MALLSQFLMLLFLAVGASLGQCPPREDIRPCYCSAVSFETFEDFNIKVFCRKVDDVDDVRRVLQSVKGIKKVKVEFYNSRLGSVPSDLFKGLHVTHVYFNNCVLKRLGDEGRSALEGLEDIVEKLKVQASFSEADPLIFFNVSRFSALWHLNVGKNNVKELGNEWFAEGPANLNQLTFSSNKIMRLGDRAFTQLTNIQQLSIEHNQIETLTRSMFPSPAMRLYSIYLSDNKISSLPVDMFSNMPALKAVSLFRNFLKRIPEATWQPVWSKLESLNLNDNPLNCDAEIEWTFKERRPNGLEGKCVSPDEKTGVDLKKVIDDNQKDK